MDSVRKYIAASQICTDGTFLTPQPCTGTGHIYIAGVKWRKFQSFQSHLPIPTDKYWVSIFRQTMPLYFHGLKIVTVHNHPVVTHQFCIISQLMEYLLINQDTVIIRGTHYILLHWCFTPYNCCLFISWSRPSDLMRLHVPIRPFPGSFLASLPFWIIL